MTTTTVETETVRAHDAEVVVQAGEWLAALVACRQDTALAFLVQLAERGVSVTASGGKLAVTPVSSLTATDRAAIGRHKRGILALLSPGPNIYGQTEFIQEWWIERDLVERRLAACPPGPAFNELAAMAAIEVVGPHDWAKLQPDFRKMEAEVRSLNGGRLPPALFWRAAPHDRLAQGVQP